jgi:hypothetical protein
MHAGVEFWSALAALATRIEYCAATEAQRRRMILDAYDQLGPLGKETVLAELRFSLAELTALERALASRQAPAQHRPCSQDGQDLPADDAEAKDPRIDNRS